MINKQDFINKSTSLYDMDAIGGLTPERAPAAEKTPVDYMMEEEELGPEVQVAGFGSALRGAVNRISPKKYQTTRSVADIRTGIKGGEGRPELTEGDIENVLGAESPEGMFSGAEPTAMGGRTTERNINLDNLETPDDIKTIIDDMVQFQGGNIEARRGTMPHMETMQEAENIDAIELITGWKPATTWNAEQITAARQLLVDTATGVQAEAKRLMSDPESASDADWANFSRMQSTFAAVNQTVQGATAEAGRTLSALKIPVTGVDRSNAIHSILEKHGGPELVKKKAELIAGLEGMDPDYLSRQVNDAIGAPDQGVLAEIWVNGRLSSPVTHSVNIVSNSFMQLYESYMVKPSAAVIGRIREFATGADDAIAFEEVGAETYGMLSAFGEAIELFGKRIGGQDGTDLFFSMSKTEMTEWNAFSAERLLPVSMQQTSLARAVDFIGDWYVRMPGRFLESEDLFFKTIAYRKELNAQAVRTARLEGLGGEAYDSRVRDLINNPTQEMNNSASSRADYETFTNDPGQYDSMFGNLAKSASYMTSRHPTLKFVAPFIRTPSNILRYATENSMLGPVTKKWREDFKAGGVKRDMALARFSLGTMAYMSVMQMYEAGSITGNGPTDRGSRGALRQLGWQPNSIRVDDTYYDFNRLDPMGFSMSMIASGMDRAKYARTDDEATVIMLETVMGMGESFMDKTFMTGFAEMFKLVGGEGGAVKAGTRFASQITSSFIPAWLTLGAKAQDVNAESQYIVRDPGKFSKSFEGIWSNFSKSMNNRTPWGKTDLPAQRNWKGEVVTHSGGGWADEMFFIKRSEAKNDPATRALLENWVAPTVPGQIQSFPLPQEIAMMYGKVELDIDILDLDENAGAVFETFQTYIGKARNSLISDFASSEQYTEMEEMYKGNESVASSILSSLLETGLQVGKAQFFADYNDLAKQKGWRQFTDEDIIEILERRAGEQGKVFPAPVQPGGIPEF